MLCVEVLFPLDTFILALGYQIFLHLMGPTKDGSWNSMISAYLNRQIFANIGICLYCFLGEEGTLIRD